MWRGEMENYCFVGTEFQFKEDDKVPEIDGYRTM